MELLDAMEEMEQRAAAATTAEVPGPADFLERQVCLVQSKLREAWRVQHNGEAVAISYYWALSKVGNRAAAVVSTNGGGGTHTPVVVIDPVLEAASADGGVPGRCDGGCGAH